MEKEPFAATVSPEELAAGFTRTTLPNPNQYAYEPDLIRVVVRHIDDQTIVVKLVSPIGGVDYVVADPATLRPKLGHSPMHSLGELARRFPIAN